MGRRTSHRPGTFSWVELATADPGAAKSFYTTLFGWDTEDDDAGGTLYTICRLEGDAVCGLFEMPAEMAAAGATPSWMSYVTVDDADAAVASAKELGGDAIEDAFDVLDLGRTAPLRDPQGAAFAVWQPGKRIGAERVNDVGCLCMNELATTDLGPARSFYEGLFGWTTETIDTGPGGPPTAYGQNHGRLNASFGLVEEGIAPHWRPYFTVESIERTLGRARELGGDQLLGPTQIPDGGSIAILRDPQQAVFALFAGEVDP
jgi:predicted enzyme related to lactoylglutathione lyase